MWTTEAVNLPKSLRSDLPAIRLSGARCKGSRALGRRAETPPRRSRGGSWVGGQLWAARVHYPVIELVAVAREHIGLVQSAANLALHFLIQAGGQSSCIARWAP